MVRILTGIQKGLAEVTDVKSYMKTWKKGERWGIGGQLSILKYWHVIYLSFFLIALLYFLGCLHELSTVNQWNTLPPVLFSFGYPLKVK